MESQESSTDETIRKCLTDSLSMLRLYALSLTGDSGRAADLLQETSVKVLCNSGSFVYNGNFNGWVATIMYNIFIIFPIKGEKT